MRVLSLFDLTGYMVKPWTEAGYDTTIVDLQHRNENNPNASRAISLDLSDENSLIDLLDEINPSIVFGFPPCTDLAISGARWFETKFKKDPDFQNKAVNLAKTVMLSGDYNNVPWMLENPVSALSTKWRKPDFIFNPADFGGYLSEDDIHPEYPDYIAPRDAYNKKTCIWIGNNFIIPQKKKVPVISNLSTQYLKLGGKSIKTKNIRSATPRGFAVAVFEANKRPL